MTTTNRKNFNPGRLLLALVAYFICSSPWVAAQAASLAYMAQQNGDFGTIDLTTGKFTLLGKSATTLAGLAAEDGVLFGTSVYMNPTVLYRVNASNGALTKVGQLGSLDIVIFGSTTTALYALDASSFLYEINPKTGEATTVGNTGISLSGYYTLSNNAERLFISSGTNLYTLNVTTGAPTLVGSTDGPQLGGLFEENNLFYGGQDSGFLSIDTVNSTTGVVTAGPEVTGAASEIYGLAPNPVTLGETSTTLTGSPTSGITGTSVEFKVTVVEKYGFLFVPSGSVTFLNKSATLGSATLNASGQATFSTGALPAGTNSITALYKGDSHNATSASSAVTITFKVDVPNVVGSTQAAASSAITKVGLTVGTITQQASTTVPSGAVITESPAAGIAVAAGVAVNLVISSGSTSSSLTLSTTALSFGNQAANASSTAKVVTLSNLGSGSVSLTAIGLSGSQADDFTLSKTCGSILAAGSSCTLSVAFKPVSAGAKTASISITDNASGSPQTITLSGTGVTSGESGAVKLSANSLSFANQAANTASVAKVVTVTNSGTGSLTFTSIALAGSQADDFVLSKTCGTTLAAGGSCTISVAFKPVSTGLKTATVSLADTASGSPQTVSLSGTGIASTASAVKLSATSLSFANQAVKTASANETLTVTNSGTGSLSFTSIALTGGQADDYAFTNTCGMTLAAGASCAISVHFTPVSAGLKTAGVSIADSAASSPQTVALTGTGIAAP